jgi:hypothetical protein
MVTAKAVMAGLVPAIHGFPVSKTWMPGTRPGMTAEYYPPRISAAASTTARTILS